MSKRTPSVAKGQVRQKSEESTEIPTDSGPKWSLMRAVAPLLGQDGLVIIAAILAALLAVKIGVDSYLAYGSAVFGIAAYSFLTWTRLRKE